MRTIGNWFECSPEATTLVQLCGLSDSQERDRLQDAILDNILTDGSVKPFNEFVAWLLDRTGMPFFRKWTSEEVETVGCQMLSGFSYMIDLHAVRPIRLDSKEIDIDALRLVFVDMG